MRINEYGEWVEEEQDLLQMDPQQLDLERLEEGMPEQQQQPEPEQQMPQIYGTGYGISDQPPPQRNPAEPTRPTPYHPNIPLPKEGEGYRKFVNGQWVGQDAPGAPQDLQTGKSFDPRPPQPTPEELAQRQQQQAGMELEQLLGDQPLAQSERMQLQRLQTQKSYINQMVRSNRMKPHEALREMQRTNEEIGRLVRRQEQSRLAEQKRMDQEETRIAKQQALSDTTKMDVIRDNNMRATKTFLAQNPDYEMGEIDISTGRAKLVKKGAGDQKAQAAEQKAMETKMKAWDTATLKVEDDYFKAVEAARSSARQHINDTSSRKDSEGKEIKTWNEGDRVNYEALVKEKIGQLNALREQKLKTLGPRPGAPQAPQTQPVQGLVGGGGGQGMQPQAPPQPLEQQPAPPPMSQTDRDVVALQALGSDQRAPQEVRSAAGALLDIMTKYPNIKSAPASEAARAKALREILNKQMQQATQPGGVP